MKHLLFALFFSFSALSAFAQGMRIIFQDALYGTANGVALSTSVMALNREFDVDQLRWGVGVGILWGVGTGIYDLSQAGGSDEYFVEGTFSQGSTSSAITLMDTGYGAGTGMLLGFSWALIANRRIDNALLTGYGLGVIGGFAFGIVDAFVLSRSSDMPFKGSGKDFFSAAPRRGDVYLSGPRPNAVVLPAQDGGYSIRPAVTVASARFQF